MMRQHTHLNGLFETFFEAYGQKNSLTVFTYQDAAMARALREVMPKSLHGLCTWNLQKKVIKCFNHLREYCL